jgi:hypothetical protein
MTATRIGISLVVLGLGWLFLAGGLHYVREWRVGRRQGLPRTRR